MFVPEALNKREQVSYRLHLLYNICEGVIEGVFLLSSFVFVKALLGGNYQLSMLFQSMVAIYIVSVFINELLQRVANQKRFLLISGVITRVPLFLFLFYTPQVAGDDAYRILFLSIFAVFYSSRTFIFPVINQFLKQAYRPVNFGKLYSYASTFRKGVIIVSTFVFGLLCDLDPFVFRYIFPLCGLLGIFSLYIFTRIPYIYSVNETLVRGGVVVSVKNTFRSMFAIVKGNRPYLHFELSFMLYGVGFMLTFPVITIFFDEGLGLNYSSVSFYQYWFNIISVLLLPFFGRVIGTMDPRRFGVLTFFSMLVYIASFILTDLWPVFFRLGNVTIYYTLLLGYCAYGVFMAANALLYHIGSSYFCEKELAGTYQSLHLSLTGVRGFIFPLMGVWVYEELGFVACFSLAVASLAFAMGLLFYSERKLPIAEL